MFDLNKRRIMDFGKTIEQNKKCSVNILEIANRGKAVNIRLSKGWQCYGTGNRREHDAGTAI
ncbi:MAG: hypothetical protein ACLTW9_28430 [Enterocloster sp.]